MEWNPLLLPDLTKRLVVWQCPCSHRSLLLVLLFPGTTADTAPAGQDISTPDDDSRVGSARDGESGGTLSHTSLTEKEDVVPSSLNALGSTFLPIAVYSAICLVIFLILRRKCHRVYAPRTQSTLRQPEYVRGGRSQVPRETN
jgi:hypothetical protein